MHRHRLSRILSGFATKPLHAKNHLYGDQNQSPCDRNDQAPNQLHQNPDQCVSAVHSRKSGEKSRPVGENINRGKRDYCKEHSIQNSIHFPGRNYDQEISRYSYYHVQRILCAESGGRKQTVKSSSRRRISPFTISFCVGRIRFMLNIVLNNIIGVILNQYRAFTILTLNRSLSVF